MISGLRKGSKKGEFMEIKKHFKLYKAGKRWLIGGVALASFVAASGIVTGNASADDTNSGTTPPTSATSEGNSDVTAKSVTLSAATSSSAANTAISSAAQKLDSTATTSLAVSSSSSTTISSAAKTLDSATSAPSSAVSSAQSSAATSSVANNTVSSASSSADVSASLSSSASDSSAQSSDTTDNITTSAASSAHNNGTTDNITTSAASSAQSNDTDNITTSAASSAAVSGALSGKLLLSTLSTDNSFSVTDPIYPAGMWVDPISTHYSYEWLQAETGGNQIVFSTNRTGDGVVYITELSSANKILKQYTLNQNTQVSSTTFIKTTYYNDVYFEMVRSSTNKFVTKYTASAFNNTYYTTLSYFVPKLITQTTYYVDQNGNTITDSNGNPVIAHTQTGLVGQNFTTSDNTIINGYYATTPGNANGVMSPYGQIGADYIKNYHNGVILTYTQTGPDGTMSASLSQNGTIVQTWKNIKPSDPTISYKLGNDTYGIQNPYIPQTSDIKYVYNKLGNWIINKPDGTSTSIIYPNDPSDPTKIADKTSPNYPIIPFIPGYTPTGSNGNPLTPVESSNS